MKFDTSGIDLAAFARRIGAAYGMTLISLTFTPKGEEAFSFVARDGHGGAYFVRAQDRARSGDLEGVYVAVDALRHRCGVSQALAPLSTVDGRFTWQHERFAVAVFPFVEGRSAHESDLSLAHVDQAAQIVALLHGSDHRRLPAMSRERFDNPFERPIRRALHAAASAPRTLSIHQQRLRSLLLEQQADIEATLVLMKEMRDDARRLDLQLVPTHGDPNWANFLIDRAGSLHLTDWGEVALGPRERDLTFFTGDHFAIFLVPYLRASAPMRLHRSLFRFYFYRWTVQEIADYTSRILFQDAAPEHEAYAWEELQPYLPVQHGEMATGLNRVMSDLGQFVSDGRLEIDER